MIGTGKLMNIQNQKCVGASPNSVDSHHVKESDPVVFDECNRVANVTLSWLEDLSLGDGVDKNKRMCIDAEMATNPVSGGAKCIGYWQCHKMHGPQLFKYNQKTMVELSSYGTLKSKSCFY